MGRTSSANKPVCSVRCPQTSPCSGKPCTSRTRAAGRPGAGRGDRLSTGRRRGDAAGRRDKERGEHGGLMKSLPCPKGATPKGAIKVGWRGSGHFGSTPVRPRYLANAAAPALHGVLLVVFPLVLLDLLREEGVEDEVHQLGCGGFGGTLVLVYFGRVPDGLPPDGSPATKVRAVRGDPVPRIADGYSHNEQPGPRGGSPGKKARPRAPNSRGPQWDTPTGSQAHPVAATASRRDATARQGAKPGSGDPTQRLSSLGAALGRGFSQFWEDFCSDLPVLPVPLNPQVVPAENKQKVFSSGRIPCAKPMGIQPAGLLRDAAKPSAPQKERLRGGHGAHLFPKVTPANLIKSLIQGVMRTGGSSLSPASS